MSTISSRFGRTHRVFSRMTGQSGLGAFAREGLWAMLIGLASLEPMGAAWLAQTDVQTAAASRRDGRD